MTKKAAKRSPITGTVRKTTKGPKPKPKPKKKASTTKKSRSTTKKSPSTPKKMGAPTTHLTEANIALTANMIGQRMYKYKIKAKIKELTGLSWSVGTFEKLMTAARKQIGLHLKRSRVDTKTDAIEYYESVIRNNPTGPEALNAQTRIDSILGHDAKFGNMEDEGDSAARVRAAMEEARKTVPTVPQHD